MALTNGPDMIIVKSDRELEEASEDREGRANFQDSNHERSSRAQAGGAFGANARQSESFTGRKPMCRVLAPIRQVRPDHYEPELISFGLYDRNYKHKSRSDNLSFLLQRQKERDDPASQHDPEVELLRVLSDLLVKTYQHQLSDETFSLGAPKKFKKANRMDQQREKVVLRFMEILGIEEKSLRRQVVPDEDLDRIIGMYEDGFLMKREFARHLLTLDAVFLVCFMLYMYSECKFNRALMGEKDLASIRVTNFDRRRESVKIDGIESEFDFFPLLDFFDQLGVPCNGHIMRSDLWLLENQIPLSLLRNVLRMMYGGGEEVVEKGLKALVRVALANVLPQVPGDCSKPSKVSSRIDRDVSFKHCEHLLECLYRAVCPKNWQGDGRDESPKRGSDWRDKLASCFRLAGMNYRPSYRGDDGDRKSPKGGREELKEEDSKTDELEDAILPKHNPKVLLPPISSLQKAGIRVVGEESRGCILKFAQAKRIYHKATLWLPQLRIDDSTERILRNLVAFESTISTGTGDDDHDDHILMSFLQCMNDLVNTEEDVRLLMIGPKPVIQLSFLGENKDVAVMFNNLIQHCYFEHTPQSAKLRKEYESLMTQKDENQNRVHESSSDHGEDHVFAVYRIRDVTSRIL
ncbi:hypothetical protein AXG93_4142s1270 [Marchantia polymorpha subsp. ruderalis]|uniref:Uncharacterized protein n=1 Tax=Marchantia polymorpha subsp. ruderalis TaxID=1480154 RepID=A0A176WP31_MARPO|nr:hypothetical protein AXG93_4142s1270 [Marchantia polymorpha subsp. ruderalis]